MKSQFIKIQNKLYSMIVAVFSLPLRLIYSNRYAPTGILEVTSNVQKTLIDQKEYYVVSVESGRIYTDRNKNIGIIQGEFLVPKVSWQYKKGVILPDSKNHLLTSKYFISSKPTFYSGHVVSLLSGGGANYNYYHWLFDSLPRLHLIKNIKDTTTRFLIPEETRPFQQQTLDALHISKSNRISSIICPHLGADLLTATSHPNPGTTPVQEWVVNFLRESFKHLNCSNEHAPLVYISRGDSTNSRRLLNEEYLCETLIKLGFKVFYLSQLTFAEQVNLFHNAKFIVSAHGAGLANLVFAQKGCILYELFSENYQPSMYQEISEIVKIDYHKLVCQKLQRWGSKQKSDFFIPEEAIEEILQKVVNTCH